MSGRSNINLILGACSVVFAAFVLFVWIPLDTDTGLIEKVRRQVIIGDSLAPSVAAVFILIGGLALAVFERGTGEPAAFNAKEFRFIGQVVGVIAVSFVIMRFAGQFSCLGHKYFHRRRSAIPPAARYRALETYWICPWWDYDDCRFGCPD
jgi:hypothetical protein